MANPGSAHWLGRVERGRGPIYAAIATALEAAIRDGDLQPGDRLPAQRGVAEALGVDFTTVTRAYGLAAARGLVQGATGRGTFVSARSEEDDAGLVDLSMNLPPPPAGLSLGAMLAQTAQDILGRADPAILMAYHVGGGGLGQRTAGATWLAPSLGHVSPGRVLVAAGAQAALTAALMTLCRPGDVVAADPLTYPGFAAAARRMAQRPVAVRGDDQGMAPDALDALCRTTKPRLLYLTPAMQNPTARTMDAPRRQDLAAIAERHGMWILEDDPYSRLAEAPLPAIASFAPDRTVHVATLSKTLTPGLRVAYVVCPKGLTVQMAEALHATAQMPAPLMAAIATAWIREGQAERLLKGVREEARARRTLAADLLPMAQGDPDSLHVWINLPDGAQTSALREAAQAKNLALMPAEAFAVEGDHPNGVRISLGGPGKRPVLARALGALAEVVRSEGLG